MFSMLAMVVPLPYRLLALALLAVALMGFGYVKGVSHEAAKWEAAKAEAERKAAAIQVRQAEATVKVVTQYVDRVKVVREKGADIIKEVPVYVTHEADAACVLSRGFVRLHDAAAANQIPGPAGSADAAPAGIALSTVAGTVADNYERCRENSAQLEALQDWIRQMRAAHEQQ